MESRKLITRKLTYGQIRDEAEKFRASFIFNVDIPVEIELVIEGTLGIRILPERDLQKLCDMDGFITRDFKSIYVDEYFYTDPRYYNLW